MANIYRHPDTNEFISKRAYTRLANAGRVPKSPPAMRAKAVNRMSTVTGSALTDTTAAGTKTLMPPFDPASPEAWMRMAAAAAWAKYPERAMDTGIRTPPYPTASQQDATQLSPDYPTHTNTVVTQDRVMQYLLARFNPNRGLTPKLLAQYIDQWQLGFLRYLSLSWTFLKENDDQIKPVTTKREYAVSRLKWEIMTTEESAEAKVHKDALQAAYSGLRVSHKLDQNMQGGVSLLIRLMMKAIGDKFAPFEIVWRPDNVDGLTADLSYVPIWFFENRTGQLRYLPYELALDGIPLDAGGWLVVVGDGLLLATSICYIYKQLALKNWARFTEKFSVPTILAKTNAAFGSTEWNELSQGLANFMSDGFIQFNKTSTEVEAFSHTVAGENPAERFCDRMDRAIARLWRGGDLSTMSRGTSGGVGALPQIAQEDEIAEADCALLSESLNFYFDRWVIKYRFGTDQPKAKFRIVPPKNIDTNKEIAVLEAATQLGVEVSVNDARSRLDLAEPEEGEDTLTPPVQPVENSQGTRPDKRAGGVKSKPSSP